MTAVHRVPTSPVSPPKLDPGGSAAPPPPSSTKPLDLLKFVALSVAVHADAVEAATDATQSALLQMRAEEETLNHLDRRLQGLLKEQRRLHAIRNAIAQSQEGRRRTDTLLREQQKRLDEEADRARGSNWKRIQSSCGSGSGSGANPRRRQGEEPEGSVATEDTASLEQREREASTLDLEVERTRRLVSKLSQQSVRAKLLQLETLKQQVREIDGRALMEEMVVGFRFPEEVEALWCGGSAVERSAAANVSPEAGKQKQQPTSTRRSKPTPPPSPAARKVVAVVDHTNVDLLLARATQRLTGRYKDVLALLTNTAMDKGQRPQQVFSSLLYADYLDAVDGNPDAAAVQVLQSFSRATLAEHYSRKCHDAVVDERIAEACLAGEQRHAGHASLPSSVLSPFDFCALPTHWASTAALTDIAEDELLPPARHVLTRRFSFSDAKEMKDVERLRVDVQRLLVQDLMRDDALLDDVLSTAHGGRPTGGLSKKERFVAEARLSFANSAAPARPHAWPTVVSTAGDEH